MGSAQIDSGPRDCPCGRKETEWPGLWGAPTCIGCSLIMHEARWADRREEKLALVADEIAEGMPATISLHANSSPATVAGVERDKTSGVIKAISLRREVGPAAGKVERYTLRSNGRYVRQGHSQGHGVQPHVGARRYERDPFEEVPPPPRFIDDGARASDEAIARAEAEAKLEDERDASRKGEIE